MAKEFVVEWHCKTPIQFVYGLLMSQEIVKSNEFGIENDEIIHEITATFSVHKMSTSPTSRSNLLSTKAQVKAAPALSPIKAYVYLTGFS